MVSKYKILVCGGRDFNDYNFLEESLLKILLDKNIHSSSQVFIIHGAALGADSLADFFSKKFNIEKKAYPANWKAYGKPAGYIRNKQMLDEGKPDLVVAFYGGDGTDMMCRIAKEANVELIRFND